MLDCKYLIGEFRLWWLNSEAALQAKIERDRISEEVMNLRKLIRPRDLKERLAEEKEEKEREKLLAQQQQQGQQSSNPDQIKKPVK